MQRYANTTTVTPERTRDEIERTLKRWGVTEFIYGSLSQGPVIAFRYRKLTARFQVLLPNRDDHDLTPENCTNRNESSPVE